MPNRETRRALAKAGIPMLPEQPAKGPRGMDLIFPAILDAATSKCTCKACRLLRKAGRTLADTALEEDDDGDGDQDPG